jgi:hypothetical protein
MRDTVLQRRLCVLASQRSETAALPPTAIRRLSSGTQDPQLVPARSFSPIAAGLAQPPAIAASIAFAPTPKQAQMTGPQSAAPSRERPDKRLARWGAVMESWWKTLSVASQPGSGSGPMNTTHSSRSPSNAAARKIPRASSTYSTTSSRENPSVRKSRQLGGAALLAIL